MSCPQCGSDHVKKNGIKSRVSGSFQKMVCINCGRNYEITLEKKAAISEDSSFPSIGITEEDLRLRHDIRYKIREGAAKLTEGIYITESDFIKSIGISAGYKQHVESGDFEVYRGRAQDIIYWSHPKSILKMKEQGVLMQAKKY